jgi:hypothetical protein
MRIDPMFWGSRTPFERPSYHVKTGLATLHVAQIPNTDSSLCGMKWSRMKISELCDQKRTHYSTTWFSHTSWKCLCQVHFNPVEFPFQDAHPTCSNTIGSKTPPKIYYKVSPPLLFLLPFISKGAPLPYTFFVTIRRGGAGSGPPSSALMPYQLLSC